MTKRDPTHDLANYFHAQDKVRHMRANIEVASARLDLASINQRMAELRSQHEPLNELTSGDHDERQRILDAIFYVVIGRFPDHA